ncbi:MAG TPA: alpha/beta fold hydrolase [Gemmatimonadaceae bacterium]|nr:alpha/beta fold hydrolase [Gemmatimonadaceae bacterium]
MIVLTFLALLVVVVAWRTLWRRHVERAVAARLHPGPDGVVPGAGSIVLPESRTGSAVLLLHGFGDTPQSLGYLAAALHGRGYAVHAPLLPGHGRTLAAFRASRGAQWIDAARDALNELRTRYERVGVVGLSMGGALAAIVAAERDDIPALALLAPYLAPPPAVRLFARAAWPLGFVLPYLYGRNAKSIHDAAERARGLGYGACTPRLIAELVGVADRARALLPAVSAPTLYVQSREDNRLTAAGAMRAFQALGTVEKRLEWVAGCGHVITVDYGRERVSELVLAWMDARIRREYASAG